MQEVDREKLVTLLALYSKWWNETTKTSGSGRVDEDHVWDKCGARAPVTLVPPLCEPFLSNDAQQAAALRATQSQRCPHENPISIQIVEIT